MPLEVNDLGTIGAVRDTPAYMLPPEAFSTALNMHVVNGGLERLQGWEQVFGNLVAGNTATTKVLMHFDGPNASTVMTDSSIGGAAKTWTASGDAQLSTTQSSFGGASCSFNGNGTVTTPAHADFNLGTNDWSYKCRFYCNRSLPSFPGIFGQGDAASTAASISIRAYRNTSGHIVVEISNGTSIAISLQGTTVFSDTVNLGMHALEVSRVGNTVYLFIDGIIEATAAINFSVNSGTAQFTIGKASDQAGTNW